MHILIIDDAIEHQENMREILEHEAFTVSCASDAYTGIRLLEAQNINCVLCDHIMPHIHGEHFVSICKDLFPKIPVIIFTAYPNIDVPGLKKKGAYAVIQKTDPFHKLIATIHNALQEHAETVSFTFSHMKLEAIKTSVISRLVTLALKKARGNQSQAARMLGISRQGLIRYMKRLALHPSN